MAAPVINLGTVAVVRVISLTAEVVRTISLSVNVWD